MRKWGYLVFLGGWTLSMVYEWFLRPDYLPVWLLGGVVLDAVLAGAFLWERRKEKRGKALPPFSKAVYFAVAVLLCILLVLAVGKAELRQPPHIMFLPLYLAGIAGALFAGFWLWREEREAGQGQKNENIPKGGGN